MISDGEVFAFDYRKRVGACRVEVHQEGEAARVVYRTSWQGRYERAMDAGEWRRFRQFIEEERVDSLPPVSVVLPRGMSAHPDRAYYEHQCQAGEQVIPLDRGSGFQLVSAGFFALVTGGTFEASYGPGMEVLWAENNSDAVGVRVDLQGQPWVYLNPRSESIEGQAGPIARVIERRPIPARIASGLWTRLDGARDGELPEVLWFRSMEGDCQLWQPAGVSGDYWATRYIDEFEAEGTAIGIYHLATREFAPRLKLARFDIQYLPRMDGHADPLWVDEARGLVYFINGGHLIRVRLPASEAL